ncbi:hypothetical protein U9V99_004252 [Salmonella enterica subsp. enterica serovar Montevideo]|nr:hypothetical protein [Salmonella enterica subsp. enterica serovar Montevideo]
MNKPHLKRILAADVRVGMRIWSPSLGECFTVESLYVRGATLFLVEGIYKASVAKRGYVWQEVPRG